MLSLSVTDGNYKRLSPAHTAQTALVLNLSPAHTHQSSRHRRLNMPFRAVDIGV